MEQGQSVDQVRMHTTQIEGLADLLRGIRLNVFNIVQNLKAHKTRIQLLEKRLRAMDTATTTNPRHNSQEIYEAVDDIFSNRASQSQRSHSSRTSTDEIVRLIDDMTHSQGRRSTTPRTSQMTWPVKTNTRDGQAQIQEHPPRTI